MVSAPTSRSGRSEATRSESSRFKPYESILKFHSVPTRTRTSEHSVTNITRDQRESIRLPPWRRPLGSTFFMLNSQFAKVYGEVIPPDEADEYMDILERTFRGFSDIIVGSDQVVVDDQALIEPNMAGEGWVLEDEPRRGWIAGETEVIYDEVTVDPAFTSTPSRSRCASPSSMTWSPR